MTDENTKKMLIYAVLFVLAFSILMYFAIVYLLKIDFTKLVYG